MIGDFEEVEQVERARSETADDHKPFALRYFSASSTLHSVPPAFCSRVSTPEAAFRDRTDQGGRRAIAQCTHLEFRRPWQQRRRRGFGSSPCRGAYAVSIQSHAFIHVLAAPSSWIEMALSRRNSRR